MTRPFAAILLCSACLIASRSPAAPLDAYGRLPSIERAAISPDGEHLAFVVTDGDKRTISVFATKDRKLIAKFAAGEDRVRSLRWAGPDHVIITRSSTIHFQELKGWKREWWVPADADIRTGRIRPIFSDIDDAMNVTFGRPMLRTVGGKSALFIEGLHFNSGQGRDSLFEFGLDTGGVKLIREGAATTVGWLVDGVGNPIAEDQYDDQAHSWTLLYHAPGAWKVAKTVDAPVDRPWMQGLGRDGRSILIEDFEETGDGETNEVMREVSSVQPRWSEPTTIDEDDDALLDPSTDALIGRHSLIGDEDHYEFYDPMLQKYWNAAAKAYPGARVLLVSLSDDRKTMVLSVDSPTEGPSYALVDIAAGSSVWLGGPYDGVLADLAPAAPIRFKAGDGLSLSGYLTTPKGVAAKNLPLVVLPDTGLASRDAPGFDWMAQAMASRGYAVLQVNTRGSDGFGWGFLSAGFGQLGRMMQTDISDGVRYLAAQGTIDPKRVCIVGLDYGGYAALAGVSLEAGVYRCAVSVAGLSDLKRYVGWAGYEYEYGRRARRLWLRYLGVKDLADAKLAEISPIDHIDKVSAPVLLMHGTDDTVAPFEQSQIMFDALRKAGKPVDLVALKHEDHNLLAGDTRLQMLQATMAFLAKNNPP